MSVVQTSKFHGNPLFFTLLYMMVNMGDEFQHSQKSLILMQLGRMILRFFFQLQSFSLCVQFPDLKYFLFFFIWQIATTNHCGPYI